MAKYGLQEGDDTEDEEEEEEAAGEWASSWLHLEGQRAALNGNQVVLLVPAAGFAMQPDQACVEAAIYTKLLSMQSIPWRRLA